MHIIYPLWFHFLFHSNQLYHPIFPPFCDFFGYNQKIILYRFTPVYIKDLCKLTPSLKNYLVVIISSFIYSTKNLLIFYTAHGINNCRYFVQYQFIVYCTTSWLGFQFSAMSFSHWYNVLDSLYVSIVVQTPKSCVIVPIFSSFTRYSDICELIVLSQL